MNVAIKDEGLLSKAVIVDIGPKYYPVHHQKILEGLNAINPAQLEKRSDADDILSNYVPSFAERQFLLNNLYRADNGFAWRFNLDTIAKNIENVGEAVTKEISESLPVLFVRGGESHYILDEDIDPIHQQIKNSTVKTIEGSGHWVHAQAPDEFYSELMEFLNA